MEELMRTNDAVLLSFAEALLKEAGFHPILFDTNMSIMEGSLGILPRRLVVPQAEAAAARRLLGEAGIGDELAPGRP
ncbi:MAG: DUF2007 domain-containing protein [Bauldia sp.]|nr:DUF2007 domain-containing protein [Bauldia sp.]